VGSLISEALLARVREGTSSKMDKYLLVLDYYRQKGGGTVVVYPEELLAHYGLPAGGQACARLGRYLSAKLELRSPKYWLRNSDFVVIDRFWENGRVSYLLMDSRDVISKSYQMKDKKARVNQSD